MENPFVYTRYVEGNKFCNRDKEQKDLLNFINNSQNVLLYSHRRLGKTSLLHQVFRKIEKQKLQIGKLFIDLYGTLTEEDFLTSIFKNLYQIESKTDRILKAATKIIQSVKFKHTFDPVSQSYTVTPEFDTSDPKLLLESVMKIFETYSKNKKMVVVFDEFQEVANYSDIDFEKRLRTHVQGHKNISYIFSGSQTHILTRMFNDSSRAFYKQAQTYPIKDIAYNKYQIWIKKLFAKGNRLIKDDLINDIVSRCKGHPMYIQQFLYFLWDKAEINSTKNIVDLVEKEILELKSTEYINLWDTLTQNQKKTLKLIIINKGQDLYNSKSLQKVGLKNSSLVHRAIGSLIAKEVITKSTKYKIQDVFFKTWIYKFINN